MARKAGIVTAAWIHARAWEDSLPGPLFSLSLSALFYPACLPEVSWGTMENYDRARYTCNGGGIFFLRTSLERLFDGKKMGSNPDGQDG